MDKCELPMKDLLKEVEGTYKRLTEENERLTEILNRRRELLNEVNEVLKLLKHLKDFTFGFDSDFMNAKTPVERFMVYLKKKEGIDLSQEYNSFVESEKKNEE